MIDIARVLWNDDRVSERVVIDPEICNGKPVIRGTRITVQTILEFLAAGDSVEEVLEEYPNLTRDDLHACFEVASRLLANQFSTQSVA